MNRKLRNESSIQITAVIFAACLSLSLGSSKDNSQQRSYIDIDASDPFKVPKTSEYVNQPVPEYDESGNKKHNTHEDGGLFHYKIGSLDIQPENNYHSQGYMNRNYDDSKNSQYSEQNYQGDNEQGQFNEPEIPVNQEESPQDTAPEEYNGNFNDEGEHTVGESRHYVPKGEMRQEESENDQMEEGSHYEPREEQENRGQDEEPFSRKFTGSRRDDADHGRERESPREEEMEDERGRETGRGRYHDNERERPDSANGDRREIDDRYEKDFYKEGNNHGDERDDSREERKRHEYD